MFQVSRLFLFAGALSIGTVVSPYALNGQSPNAPAVRDSGAMVAAIDSTVARNDSTLAGPRMVRAGFRPEVASLAVIPLQGSSGSRGLGAGSNVALMGVGAAAIIVGSMVGGDGGTMISIGGGVIGLIGLFRWLR